MKFGDWSESTHETEKQRKAIKSAASADTTPSHVDKEAQTARFPKSDGFEYETSLNSCTCKIFSISHPHVPCKHIYRLAMELGLVDIPFKSGINKNIRNMMLPDIIQLSVPTAKKLHSILYRSIYRDELFFYAYEGAPTEVFDELLDCHLLS